MKIIKNLVRYIIGIISFFSSYIIPKKNNLYIFGSINGKTFSGNSKTFFLYYLNIDKKKNVYYMTRNKELFNLNIKNIIYINSIKGYWLFLRAKYIFTDCDLYDVSSGLSYQPGNFNVINLWHGDPIKAIGYLSIAKYTKGKEGISKLVFKNYFKNIVKLGCSSSIYFKEILNKGHLTNKYKVTGLPRNEIFFNDELDFYNIKKEFQLDKYNKIILYVPTWRQDNKNLSPFSSDTLELLNNYFKENNILFIIKAHQNSEKILKNKHSNIIDISKFNIDSQELMKYSDVMITDYSSIFIDFLLLDKPIIFYAYDYNKYKEKLVNLVDKYENCVIKEGICYNEIELLDMIKKNNILNDVIGYKEKFLTLKNKYHKFQKGGYLKNIINEIENDL